MMEKRLMQKKSEQSQFLFKLVSNQAILPNHELVILTKFHDNWPEKVDFVHLVYFMRHFAFFCISLYYISNSNDSTITILFTTLIEQIFLQDLSKYMVSLKK